MLNFRSLLLIAIIVVLPAVVGTFVAPRAGVLADTVAGADTASTVMLQP